MNINTSTLEHVIPEYVHPDDVTGLETLSLHLDRYEFAAQYIRPGRLLDIACGVGYGTRLLIDRSHVDITAIGVDISEETISYAKEKYSTERIHYVVGDATHFTDPGGFDMIVSLETIEHLPQPGSFVTHLMRLLRPGGILIGSAPTTPSMDANPYHLHDFTERSFRRIFERHRLEEVSCLRQVQSFKVISLLTRKEARAKDMRRNLPSYYLSHPGSLMRRIFSTFRYGFTNHYITIAWQARDQIA
jgi:SAM-dependent methyltransferase